MKGNIMDLSKHVENPNSEIELNAINELGSFVELFVDSPVFKHEGTIYETVSRKANSLDEIKNSFNEHNNKIAFRSIQHRDWTVPPSFLVKFAILN